MIDASPDGVLLLDASGMIVFANAMITSLFGFSPTDTAIGEHVDNLLPDDVRDAHAVLRADFQTDPHTRTMGIGLALLARRRDGSVFPVEVSLSPIYDRDGYATIATVRDISDRVTLEASAQRDRNALAAAQELSLIHI